MKATEDYSKYKANIIEDQKSQHVHVDAHLLPVLVFYHDVEPQAVSKEPKDANYWRKNDVAVIGEFLVKFLRYFEQWRIETWHY